MRHFNNLLRCRSGNTAITFAILLLPILAAGGAAVDYSRGFSAKTHVQDAIDAAALTVAVHQGTEAERIAAGENIFTASLPANLAELDPVISIEIESGSVIASSEAALPTTILGVFGFDQLEIGGHAEVGMSGIGNAEIVFVLDYSSSMEDQYQAMRDAVVNLVDEVTDNLTSNDIKVGLVPFAREVYASMDGKYVHGGTDGVTWSNCTRGRKWPWVWKDNTPTGADKSKWGLLDDDDYSDVEEPDYYEDCDHYTDNDLIIRPLTTDHNGTVAQLNAMEPYAGTNLSLGVQFGFQVLSPNAPWQEGVSYLDEDWKKFMIVLSDGRHNKEGFGPGSEWSDEQGRENMALTCSRAKSEGITIITVAYELDDEEGKEELENCASDNQYYLEGSEENIAEVFNEIGVLMAGDPYLKK